MPKTLVKINSYVDLSRFFLLFVLFTIGFGVFVASLAEKEYLIVIIQFLLFAFSFVFRKLFPTNSQLKIGDFSAFFLSGTLAIYVVLFLFPGHPISAFLPESILLGLGNVFLFLVAMNYLPKINNLSFSIIYVLAAFLLMRASLVQDWASKNDIWIYVVFGAPFIVLLDTLFPLRAFLKQKN